MAPSSNAIRLAWSQFAHQRLEDEELILIPTGVHRNLTASSDINRLSVLMIPGFRGEVPSDEIP